MIIMIKVLKKNNKGQALVELALILPILLLFLFGIMEFGRIFGTYLTVTNAAREGSRTAVVGAIDTEIVSVIQNYTTILDSSKLIISISPEMGYRHRGDGVKVRVEYPVTIYAPIISDIIGNPYSVAAETVMRVE